MFVVMVMSDVRTLKRSKGVAVGVGNGGDEGAGSGGVVGRRAFVTASLSLVIARHDGWSRSAGTCWWASAGGASDATHSRVAVAGQAPDAVAVQSSVGAPVGEDALAGDLVVVGEGCCAPVKLGTAVTAEAAGDRAADRR